MIGFNDSRSTAMDLSHNSFLSPLSISSSFFICDSNDTTSPLYRHIDFALERSERFSCRPATCVAHYIFSIETSLLVSLIVNFSPGSRVYSNR